MISLNQNCRRGRWWLAMTTVTTGLLVLPAQAQSIYGPGGLLLNPTADMPAKGQLSPAALALQQSGPGAVGGRRTLATYSLNYGLTENIEIGATHVRLNPTGAGTKPDPSQGASVKVRLLRGKVDGRPDVVAGASFLSGGDLDAQTGFLAARFSTGSEEPEKQTNLHFGLLYARELYGARRDRVAPYAGVDTPLTKNVRGFAEVRMRLKADDPTQRDVRTPVAVGLVWNPWRNIKVLVAVANHGPSRQYRPAIGVGYTFQSGGSKK